MLKVYNSLTNKKEIFKPIHNKNVNIFVCGITPYNSPHIGNLRTCMNYDLIVRYLRHLKYKVFYLQNVTDIDDKIIKATKTEQISWHELANKYFKEYMLLNKKLGVKSVSKYAKATHHIKEIISQVKTLIEKGYAYESNGSVYFEVGKFKNYGKLSGQDLKKLHAGTRLEKDENKKHPYDFVLWKAKKEEGEPSWPSPWGHGRPGWHIEDTAISESFFGPQYDIHGGAVELKFPHHEAEIAQQESASGKKPLVKYWIHSGILMVNGEKMSKSLNNFITGKDMIEKHDPDYFRFMTVSTHYRSTIDYSENLVVQAKHNLNKIREFANSLKKIKSEKGVKSDLIKSQREFVESMDDDFNTPKALAVIFMLMNNINKLIAENKLTKTEAKKILDFFKMAENIFGVSFIKNISKKIPAPIIELARQREEYRQQSNWQKSDEIRDIIKSKGYEIKDLKEGYEIKITMTE